MPRMFENAEGCRARRIVWEREGCKDLKCGWRGFLEVPRFVGRWAQSDSVELRVESGLL